jgi:hypothetical protein
MTYSEYIVEHLDNSIAYAEYITEQLNKPSSLDPHYKEKKLREVRQKKIKEILGEDADGILVESMKDSNDIKKIDIWF